jgi:hypothetical protein
VEYLPDIFIFKFFKIKFHVVLAILVSLIFNVKSVYGAAGYLVNNGRYLVAASDGTVLLRQNPFSKGDRPLELTKGAIKVHNEDLYVQGTKDGKVALGDFNSRQQGVQIKSQKLGFKDGSTYFMNVRNTNVNWVKNGKSAGWALTNDPPAIPVEHKARRNTINFSGQNLFSNLLAIARRFLAILISIASRLLAILITIPGKLLPILNTIPDNAISVVVIGTGLYMMYRSISGSTS